MRLLLAACAVLALAVLLASRRRPAWSGGYPLDDAEGDALEPDPYLVELLRSKR